jgi:hypothetical protein
MRKIQNFAGVVSILNVNYSESLVSAQSLTETSTSDFSIQSLTETSTSDLSISGVGTVSNRTSSSDLPWEVKGAGM